MNVKLTQDELQAIKKKAEKANTGNFYEFIKTARQDIPKLLAEIERLQAEVHEHSTHNGHLIAAHIIPTKEENKRLQAEVERLQQVLHDISTITTEVNAMTTLSRARNMAYKAVNTNE